MITFIKKTGTTIFLLLFAASFWGCKDHFTQVIKQMANVPIYQPYEEMRAPVEMGTESAIRRPGKIYFKDNYIFISEVGKGIHIYDNSNPSSPVHVSFIKIPGNVDIAIKNDVLYADNFTDLIVVDVSDLTDCKMISRYKDVFPYALPPYDESCPIAQIDRNIGLIIGWKLEESETVCRDRECGGQFPVWPSFAFSAEQTAGFSAFDGNVGSRGGRTGGVPGSMARFALTDDYLYTVSETDLQPFNIQTPSAPVIGDKISIGMGIETIFPYEESLFIGSQTGMFIYDVSTPSNPNLLSEFVHARSCDPVVVEGDYAYVTMRGGGNCGGWTNELNVVNISNLSNPWLVSSRNMTSPSGLGVDNGKLFLCDGDAGLKVFSTSNPSNIQLLDTKAEINAFDVIPYNNVLMMIGSDGLYQYNYSNINELELLSIIPIN